MQNGHHPPVLFLLVSALSLVLSLRGMEILSLESTTRKGTTFSFSRCWLLPMGGGGANKLLQLFVAASFTRSTSERVCCCDRTRNQRKKKTFVSSFFFLNIFFGELSLLSFLFLLHLFLFSTSFVHIRAGQVGRRDKHNS